MALPRLPESVEVLCEETFGRQRRIVVRDFQPGMHDLITSRAGVLGLRQRALSLEEIFIACTRGSLGEPPSPEATADKPRPASESRRDVTEAGAAGGSRS